MWSINATMQSRAVTVSRYHASQLPQPLPQYYTMIGRGAADDDDADIRGEYIVYDVFSTDTCGHAPFLLTDSVDQIEQYSQGVCVCVCGQ